MNSTRSSTASGRSAAGAQRRTGAARNAAVKVREKEKEKVAQSRAGVPAHPSASLETIQGALTPIGRDDASLRKQATRAPIVKPGAGEYVGLCGYDPNFLGVKISLEDLIPLEMRARIAPQMDNTVKGFARYSLPFDRFTSFVDGKRRMPLLVAENIGVKEGGQEQWWDVRRPTDDWNIDTRISSRRQLNEKAYRRNALDQGHLGPEANATCALSEEAALSAMKRTCRYSNACPQHEKLNRVTWLGLEELIRKNSKKGNIPVCAFVGPVLRDDDPQYKSPDGVKYQMPRQFFKIVVTCVNGEPAAAGYLLSHEEYLDSLGPNSAPHAKARRQAQTRAVDAHVFEGYKTFSVPIAEIAALTGFNLKQLEEWDWMKKDASPAPSSRAQGKAAQKRPRYHAIGEPAGAKSAPHARAARQHRPEDVQAALSREPSVRALFGRTHPESR